MSNIERVIAAARAHVNTWVQMPLSEGQRESLAALRDSLDAIDREEQQDEPIARDGCQCGFCVSMRKIEAKQQKGER